MVHSVEGFTKIEVYHVHPFFLSKALLNILGDCNRIVLFSISDSFNFLGIGTRNNDFQFCGTIPLTRILLNIVVHIRAKKSLLYLTILACIALGPGSLLILSC